MNQIHSANSLKTKDLADNSFHFKDLALIPPQVFESQRPFSGGSKSASRVPQSVSIGRSYAKRLMSFHLRKIYFSANWHFTPLDLK